MAEIVVATLIESIAAALAEVIVSHSFRSRTSQNVRNSMNRIKRELNVMGAFLKNINKHQFEDEDILVTWVKLIQDEAYDIEKIIDEYTHAINSQIGGGVMGYLNGIFSEPKASALHEIAKKLESTEVNLAHLSRMKELYGIKIPETTASLSEHSVPTRLAESVHFIEEDGLVGIDDYKYQLIRLLTDEEPRRTLVAVYGMGGVGKSTLVSIVYKDQIIISHFSCRVWVYVSQDYNFNVLVRKLLNELYRERMEETTFFFDSMSIRGLVETLRSLLDDKRYLIILDDVWHANLWTDISDALIDNSCSSRVVVTTRIQEVTSVTNAGRIMNLEPLSGEMAWALFCKKAFPGVDGNNCPVELEHWSRKMVNKCEGLPLAIVSIGNLLAHKEREESIWNNIYDSLTWSSHENLRHTGLENVSKILSLSIRNLPHHLRNCLLLCSLFPEDYPIARNRLIRLLVAEGFVKEMGQRSLEEVAEEYINQLVGRCLLQVTETNESGRLRFCRVHDLVRELIIERSKDEYFAEVYDGKPGQLSDRLRRVSVIKDGQGATDKLSKKMPHLRSFFSFSPVSTSLLSKCKLLRVLDLCSAPVEALPDEIGSLANLHYLSIRETNVQILPKSLGNLRKLETLDAMYSHVEELPSGITKLENLRHLSVKKFHRQTSRYTVLGGGVKVPEGIGCLKRLQTLKAVVAGETMTGEATIRQLGKLNQMKSLDIRGVTTIHSVYLSASLSKMDHLLRVVVMARYRDDTLMLSHLTPPPQLRKLSLYGRLDKGKLPDWFSSLKNLTHLVLKMSRLKEDSLSSLMALPSLVSLFLMQAYDGSKLCFHARQLDRLMSLGLCDMIHLNCIEIEKNALENLLELNLVRCCELKTIPLGIEHLTRLRKLELEGMPDELVKQLQEGEITEEDRKRVKHIPVILKSFQIDGIWKEEKLL